MATRSAIGYKTASGKVTAIYCHWDSGLAHNGKILFFNYQGIEKIKALIALGDVSSLGKDIDSSVYYGRDTGETNIEPKTFEDVDEYVTRMSEQNCELVYLWNGNEWIVSNGTLQFDRVEDLILHPMFNL